MKNKIKFLILILITLSFANCSSGSNSGIFSDPSDLAVDSTNDRLFISQARGELFALAASDLSHIGNQPAVSEDLNEDIHDLLPYVTTNLGVYSNGSSSRIFIMGALEDESDNSVLNRIRVLDFDGTTYTEASFSPITITDNDAGTDETDNSFADLIVDQTNGSIFVTDTSAGMLYILSATDGTQVTTPINIGGNPQGMALDNGRLYVCNSSSTAAEQVISVINLTGFTETEIDVDISCDQIAVATNSTGTVMLVNRHDEQQVLIHTVDTTTYASSTAIASSDTTISADGILTSGEGISSAIADIIISQDSTGIISAYLSEQDGNIEYISIPATLATYTLDTLSTLALSMSQGDVYQNSDNTGITGFFIAETGSLVSIDFGTSDVDLHI